MKRGPAQGLTLTIFGKECMLLLLTKACISAPKGAPIHIETISLFHLHHFTALPFKFLSAYLYHFLKSFSSSQYLFFV